MENYTNILQKVIQDSKFSMIQGEMELYQYVLTGLQNSSKIGRRLGYVVQIRKKAAPNKGDMVFIRHPDGELVVHENQSFHLISDEHQKLIAPLFKFKPEEEDVTLPYRCCDKIPEVGFIITKSTCVRPW